MATQVAQRFSQLLAAYRNCKKSGNKEWEDKHEVEIQKLEELLPSGCGFDKGSSLDWNLSTEEKLVFNTSFHHMNSDGYYTKWTNHQVIVKASLLFGLDFKVTGKDHGDIKEYIGSCFYSVMRDETSI